MSSALNVKFEENKRAADDPINCQSILILDDMLHEVSPRDKAFQHYFMNGRHTSPTFWTIKQAPLCYCGAKINRYGEMEHLPLHDPDFCAVNLRMKANMNFSYQLRKDKSCVCGQEMNLKKCAKCRQRFYCSKSCQIQDWTKHRKECPSLEEK